MINLPWYVWAILTVLIWGFHYNILNKAMNVVTPLYLFIQPIVLMVFLLPLYHSTITADIHNILNANNQERFFVFLAAITGTIGTLCLFQAIAVSNNPTMAALVEITYPLLVALIAYLLFKENHLNPSMAFGGVLIFLGTSLIIFNNK